MACASRYDDRDQAFAAAVRSFEQRTARKGGCDGGTEATACEQTAEGHGARHVNRHAPPASLPKVAGADRTAARRRMDTRTGARAPRSRPRSKAAPEDRRVAAIPGFRPLDRSLDDPPDLCWRCGPGPFCRAGITMGRPVTGWRPFRARRSCTTSFAMPGTVNWPASSSSRSHRRCSSARNSRASSRRNRRPAAAKCLTICTHNRALFISVPPAPAGGRGRQSTGSDRGAATSRIHYSRRAGRCARNARTCSAASWYGMQSASQLSSSSLPPARGPDMVRVPAGHQQSPVPDSLSVG